VKTYYNQRTEQRSITPAVIRHDFSLSLYFVSKYRQPVKQCVDYCTCIAKRQPMTALSHSVRLMFVDVYRSYRR